MPKLLLVIAVVAGCGGASPKKPPPAELPADKPSDLAGRWVTADEMDFSYSMTITAAAKDGGGGIDVWIDRGKMGRCEQKGTIRSHTSRTFVVIYKVGQCNPQAVNQPIEMSVASFTGASLTVVVANQSRTYQRAAGDEPGALPGAQLH